jgi:hypothetical protein
MTPWRGRELGTVWTGPATRHDRGSEREGGPPRGFAHDRDPTLAAALGSDWKGKLSLACYVVAIALAFVNQWLSDALYVLVAVLWLIPDPRVERAVVKREP